METQINIDFTDYLEKKAAGAARFVTIDGQLYYMVKGFHPATGKPTPMHTVIDVEAARAKLNSHVKSVEIFTQILQDIEAAKELMPDA